jgi:hypothetical protein
MQRSIVRGNAPPCVSVLNHPEVVASYGRAPVPALGPRFRGDDMRNGSA